MYDFECGECGERFEALVGVEERTQRCPACGADGAERRLTSFAYSRQPSAEKRRRMEDKRGTDRDGARQRFKRDLGRARKRAGGPGS